MINKAFISGILVLSLAAFGAAARVPLMALAAGALVFIGMALAGIAILGRMFPRPESALSLIVYGAILGVILGRMGLVVIGLLFGPGAAGVLVVVITMAAFGLALRAKKSVFPPWTSTDGQETRTIILVGSAALIAMALAYWGVGRDTPKGYAFVPYFNWDFLQHIGTVAELSRNMPPENPFFAGERLHYYWFYHTWPAALVNLLGITARDAYLVGLPLTNLLFIFALALMLRSYVPTRLPRTLALAMALFASSYVGLMFLLVHFLPQIADKLPNYSHATAYSNLSHSWFRDFLFEPHAVTALTFVLFAMYLQRSHADQSPGRAGLLTGLALSSALCTDAFIGLVGCGWYGVMSLWSLARQRGGRMNLASAGLVAGAVFLGAVGLGIFPMQSGLLRFKLHPITKLGPFYLLAELGPLFLFGMFGLVLLLRCREVKWTSAMFVLLLIGLIVAFSFQTPHERNIVLRKSIKVLQLPLALFSAMAVAWFFDGQRKARVQLIAVALIASGVITLATDIFQYRDLLGDRFPPTTYLEEPQMRMLDWIRENTPSDAVFQVVSEVRPERSKMDTCDPVIPSLAERRTLFANYTQPYIFQVPLEKLNRRKDDLEALFLAKSGESFGKILSNLPSHYLYVDDREPGPLAAIRELQEHGELREIHRIGTISIMVREDAPRGRTALGNHQVHDQPIDMLRAQED